MFQEWILLAYKAKNPGLTKFLLEKYAENLGTFNTVVCNPFFHDVVCEEIPRPSNWFGNRTMSYMKWPTLAKGEFFSQNGEIFEVTENFLIGRVFGVYSPVGSIYSYRRINNPLLYEGKMVKNF